jgi:leucyl aminopeptidase
MKFTCTTALASDASQVFVPYFKDGELSLPASFSQAIDNFKQAGLLSDKAGKLTTLASDAQIAHVIGAGDSEKFSENALIKWTKTLADFVFDSKLTSISIALDDLKVEGKSIHWITQKVTEAMLTSFYRYDQSKSEKAPELALEAVEFVSSEENLSLAIETGRAFAHGINIAKELGNLPGNYCNPEYLAAQARALGEKNDDIMTSVLEDADMEKEGMGSFLSVSRGSDNPGKLIVIEYKGAAEDQQPHVLVGKGLTFDSGGISLKPGQGMEEMKFDMLGAASVMGVMNVMAELKPAINVVALIAAAENMPSGRATKPGDVVTSMSGKTIEVINTDAEGRLVLCDALTYAARFNPASVIDIATLTGAIVVGLGHVPTAVYSNDDSLQEELVAAGKSTWDRAWPMPLWDDYREELDSQYADLKNIGNGRAGGSITAAVFLAQFAENYKWAHLDIAGSAWGGQNGKSASGRPVGLLSQYLLNQLTR